MRRVTPKVFVVAETRIDFGGMQDYLSHVGAPGWTTDVVSGSEHVAEFMGRLCYRSWRAKMNANVTKVREGNDTYLANIMKSRHGSVIEHGSVSFVFADVSRVLTHELVRHRVGVGISQESLRYVRLTDLGLWLPQDIEADPKVVKMFETTFKTLEELQLKLAQHFGLDDEASFDTKKKLTSAFRRAAPIGLATTIGWTTNHRNLRHVLRERSARHAEEEIRVVFAKVGRICKQRWPNIYQDFVGTEVDGITEWAPEHVKV